MSKSEVKNMNSFKAVYRALAYEGRETSEVVRGGWEAVQETRGWVERKGATVSQRSKEPSPTTTALFPRAGLRSGD